MPPVGVSNPPSATIAVPEMYEARSLARNAITRAISSGRPMRPNIDDADPRADHLAVDRSSNRKWATEHQDAGRAILEARAARASAKDSARRRHAPLYPRSSTPRPAPRTTGRCTDTNCCIRPDSTSKAHSIRGGTVQVARILRTARILPGQRLLLLHLVAADQLENSAPTRPVTAQLGQMQQARARHLHRHILVQPGRRRGGDRAGRHRVGDDVHLTTRSIRILSGS